MTPRLASLHLRSRRAVPAALTLVGVAALTWWMLAASNDPHLTTILLTTMPLGTASIVGASAGSPFGEAERTASFRLPVLRLGHLGGLLAWGAVTLAAANRAEPAADWLLVRNGAGYVGVALLTAWLLGAGIAWVVPVALGMLVAAARLAGTDPEWWWMWPAREASDRSSLAMALGLLVVGLAVVAPGGARESGGE